MRPSQAMLPYRAPWFLNSHQPHLAHPNQSAAGQKVCPDEVMYDPVDVAVAEERGDRVGALM